MSNADNAPTPSPVEARADGVRVKALEWKHDVWGCEAEGGRYRIGDNGTNWTDDRYWLFVDVDLASSRGKKFRSLDEAKAAAQADYEARILAALESTPAQPVHPDDLAVDRFAAAMKAKLKWEREERGRHGWDDPSVCSSEYLARLLVEHLAKGNAGNFEDIANFAMMLHQRGDHPSVLAQAAQPVREGQEGKAEPDDWPVDPETGLRDMSLGTLLRETRKDASQPEPAAEIAEAVKQANNAVLSMLWLPGVRAVLDGLPDDDPLRPYMKMQDETVARAERAESELAVIREALEPFASYMGETGDLDNLGAPLPDDSGVGWVYLTMGHFRRARAALANTAEEKGE